MSSRGLPTHPAALMFALGNEIPPSIVRWHGEARVTGFLRELYHEVKAAAPASAAHLCELSADRVPRPRLLRRLRRSTSTCTASPTCRAYLARLQHIAGHKPLLLAEAGSRQHSRGARRPGARSRRCTSAPRSAKARAEPSRFPGPTSGGEADTKSTTGPSVSSTRAAAQAGAGRRGAGVRRSAVSGRRTSLSGPKCRWWFAHTTRLTHWTNVSRSLMALNYPNFEVIVVNDGSRDATGEIARRYPVGLIEVSNGGLSAARNIGLAKADGRDRGLHGRRCPGRSRLAAVPRAADARTRFAGSGGPNVVPPDDPWIAQCVARAPGGPTQVLLDDRVAEHVPGCNMAFRRERPRSGRRLQSRLPRAGDDVDMCWRLQAKGYRIGFAPSALVWHHHRASVKAYWRQQVGYGEGETWLDAHHPEKFISGQMLWRGRIYSPLAVHSLALWPTPEHRRVGKRRLPLDLPHRSALRPVHAPHSGVVADVAPACASRECC